jgi:hypothetical protein
MLFLYNLEEWLETLLAVLTPRIVRACAYFQNVVIYKDIFEGTVGTASGVITQPAIRLGILSRTMILYRTMEMGMSRLSYCFCYFCSAFSTSTS